MTRLVFGVLVGLGAGGAVTTAAPAQQQAGKWQLIPSMGIIRYDRTSALSSAGSGALSGVKLWPSAGLSALYRVRSDVGIGVYLEGGRVATSPDYFPYVLLRSAGNYQLFEVTQRVVVLSYGLALSVQLPAAQRIGPFVKGGVGRHSVFPDVQRSNSTESITGTEVMAGAGVNFGVSRSVKVRLEAVDFLWFDWDRDKLDPTTSADYVNTVFPEDNPQAIGWAKPGVIHNLRLALGFTFTPSGGGPR